MPCFCGQQAVAVCSHCKFRRILNGTPELSFFLFFPFFPMIRAMPNSSMYGFIFRSIARRKTSAGRMRVVRHAEKLCVIKKTSNLLQLPLLVNSPHTFRAARSIVPHYKRVECLRTPHLCDHCHSTEMF